MNGYTINSEQLAADAFNKQAPLFDELYASDSMIRYKRQRVREHLLQFLSPHSNILELNAGTGEDAIYLADQGHHVHATDLSTEMLSILREKADSSVYKNRISQEHCPYTALTTLQNKGPFDHIFSNFAGLNCTDRLLQVLQSFSPLLKDRGVVTLVLLPEFCLWEFLMLFKGRFRTAFRRFVGKKGATAHIEGAYFRCWYYNPAYIIDALGDDYELLQLEGMCTLVPPSYIKGFPEKYPRLFAALSGIESTLKTRWPWRSIGDYYIISLRKK